MISVRDMEVTNFIGGTGFRGDPPFVQSLAALTTALFFGRTCFGLSRRVPLAQAFLDKLKHVPPRGAACAVKQTGRSESTVWPIVSSMWLRESLPRRERNSPKAACHHRSAGIEFDGQRELNGTG
jgi:hypothetical protein